MLVGAELVRLKGILDDNHWQALLWFHERSGQESRWPGPLPNGTLLASKAKGIYKPNGSKYALSVRQSLESPYPDKPVQYSPDGSWQFEYFQENLDEAKFDKEYTNRGMKSCYEDAIPVGVFIQLTPKPRSTYRILGLGIVTGYDSGYFSLAGDRPSQVQSPAVTATQPPLSSIQARADLLAEAFDPNAIEDARRRVQRNINLRSGQPGFRRTLLEAYENRCLVTGYEAQASLEAAHIVPYRGVMTNHPTNGLLLRSDIHTLFDLGMLTIDYGDQRVLLHSKLRSTRYAALEGTAVSFPRDQRFHPSRLALEEHRAFARSKGLVAQE